MEDIECCKIRLKLKTNEEIVDIKTSYSYKDKCYLIVFSTNLNRDFALEIKEYLK